jgi:hypothetical protein
MSSSLAQAPQPAIIRIAAFRFIYDEAHEIFAFTLMRQYALLNTALFSSTAETRHAAMTISKTASRISSS